CELILQELRRDRRVLLCASTHVAVDNVIERLMAEDQPARDQVIPVRIGDPKKISDAVKRWQIETLQKTERERLCRWLRAIFPSTSWRCAGATRWTTFVGALERGATAKTTGLGGERSPGGSCERTRGACSTKAPPRAGRAILAFARCASSCHPRRPSRSR